MEDGGDSGSTDPTASDPGAGIIDNTAAEENAKQAIMDLITPAMDPTIANLTMLTTAIVYTAWPAMQQFRWRAADG